VSTVIHFIIIPQLHLFLEFHSADVNSLQVIKLSEKSIGIALICKSLCNDLFDIIYSDNYYCYDFGIFLESLYVTKKRHLTPHQKTRQEQRPRSDARRKTRNGKQELAVRQTIPSSEPELRKNPLAAGDIHPTSTEQASSALLSARFGGNPLPQQFTPPVSPNLGRGNTATPMTKPPLLHGHPRRRSEQWTREVVISCPLSDERQISSRGKTRESKMSTIPPLRWTTLYLLPRSGLGIARRRHEHKAWWL